MAFSIKKIEDVLIDASFACEHIIHAARDVGMVKREIFPSTMFEAGEEASTITEYDILRKDIDLEHLKISKAWLKASGIHGEEREKLRKKWNCGWQSIVWFMNLGCPWLTFPQCCKRIDDGMRLINTGYQESSGILLDPELLAERIMENPEEMEKLFMAVQSRFRRGTVKTNRDSLVENWIRTDYTHANGWEQYKAVVPAGWGEHLPALPAVKANDATDKISH